MDLRLSVAVVARSSEMLKSHFVASLRRRTCRFALGLLVVGIAASTVLTSSARAQETQDNSETLLAYAVNIHRTPTQPWPGYGIYLGHSFFLTAAHVVGRGWLTRPKVVIAGQEYPTQVIKEGSFEQTDLTLLAVEESLLPMRLRLRRSSLCTAPPLPGQQVVTVVPEAVVRSSILSPDRLPGETRRFRTLIADVARTGNSGSGVFDLQRRCLLGIMSRKISQSKTDPLSRRTETHDIAKYFVPAAEIAAFLPPNSPF
ncbi:trypsin-like peptidase domain-containing protein [uncultured Bradyrhizobium sp.]|uniref:trypsin-like peptidase domain-containing protein n=1 Tax=uncultured Bradyrhizobium sp. TaxID=199684 RepID=UPI0026097064|nr:trypsin-like peptidase domain-containing protein [uncultured Bradyrhizobium sp.]